MPAAAKMAAIKRYRAIEPGGRLTYMALEGVKRVGVGLKMLFMELRVSPPTEGEEVWACVPGVCGEGCGGRVETPTCSETIRRYPQLGQ